MENLFKALEGTDLKYLYLEDCLIKSIHKGLTWPSKLTEFMVNSRELKKRNEWKNIQAFEWI